MPGERVKSIIGRDNFIRRIENRVDDKAFNLRQRPGRALRRRVPRIPNRNVGEGTIVGLLEAGIAVLLEDTVGVPFGANSEVTNVESTQGGRIYTVNVNAPFENMAQARAFLESTTGFTSVMTDLIEVEEMEVLNTRMLRDTYQVRILVKD